MQIIFHKDDFLFSIFPELAQNDDEQLLQALTAYYTLGNIVPQIRFEGEWLMVDIDVEGIALHEADFRRVITLCEKGNYTEAKPLLHKLIAANPSRSEYHRILGQILSDEGDQNEAINCLIDALRWDSRNYSALVMMGNIFAKYRNDITTAIKYYDEAMKWNPNDYVSLLNTGTLLLQQGKWTAAKKYLNASLQANNKYPNTHMALALVAAEENDLASAFYSATQALKLNNKRNELYERAAGLAFELAQKMIISGEGATIYKQYCAQLAKESNTPIDIVNDETILTPAKFEFAEVYKRSRHTVRFKASYPAVEHLIMHELSHLRLVIEARNEGVNKLFISRPQHKVTFLQKIALTLQKLRKMGLPEIEITKFGDSLFSGFNTQIYNAPIDLFIENLLYNEFPALRPYQFLSNYQLLLQGIQAVTEKAILDISPRDILSKSKIYNMVNAMQFRDLFGIDKLHDFKATKQEMQQVTSFYNEFLEYSDDKQPAEEYELLQHWGEDMELSDSFELVDEIAYLGATRSVTQSSPPSKTESSALNEKEILEQFEKLLSPTQSVTQSRAASDVDKDEETRRFIASHKAAGTNAEVVMYMVEALRYFEVMTKEQIKRIASEIAIKGANGYDPHKTGYSIDLIPNKTFAGLEILAYCYVSFALALPDMLMQLQMPYHEEYLMAKGLRNGKN